MLLCFTSLCVFVPCCCFIETAIVLCMQLPQWTTMVLFSFTLFRLNSFLSVFSGTKDCMTHTFSWKHKIRQLLKCIFSSVSVLLKWGWCLCVLTAGILSVFQKTQCTACFSVVWQLILQPLTISYLKTIISWYISCYLKGDSTESPQNQFYHALHPECDSSVDKGSC